MNRKLSMGAVLLLPAAIVIGGCGDANTPPTPSVQVPPAVEQRVEQGVAVLDDASITAKVKTALIAEPDLSSLAIDVDTSQNVVTLNGAVASDTARSAAERVAKEVEGVREVKNNLTVKQAS